MKLSQKRRISPSMIIATLFFSLTLFNPVFASISVSSSIYIASSNIEKLHSVLIQRGWITHLDANGSLYLYHQQQTKPASQTSMQNFEYFSKSLAGTNWSVSQDTSGDIFLSPNKRQKQVKNISMAKILPEKNTWPSSQLETIAMKLKETGWNSYFEPNGNLVLSFTQEQQQTAAHHNKNIDSLNRLLRNTGWISHRHADGTLIFTHPLISLSVTKNKSSPDTYLIT